jgi:hypothetical protein
MSGPRIPVSASRVKRANRVASRVDWCVDSDRLRRLILSPVGFWLWRWRNLPLAAFAGLRVESIDDTSAVVRLPGGWRSRNPFRSTYFAAQAMAAEMSTGAPLLVLAAASGASIATLITGIEGVFVKKLVGPGRFTFDDVAGMRAAVSRAAETGNPEAFKARSVARDAAGDVVSEWTLAWSLKRRG